VPAELATRVGALFCDVELAARDRDAWLRDHRFSNADRDLALAIWAGHWRAFAARGPALRRRFMSSLGPDLVLALAAIAHADNAARGLPGDATEFAAEVRADLDARVPLAIADLAIDGNVLMKELGVPPGRELGELLRALLEVVLDDPSANERGLLLARAATLRDKP
jgi:tRNA nucleotidyltransferase (CCA-adding enzyme)